MAVSTSRLVENTRQAMDLGPYWDFRATPKNPEPLGVLVPDLPSHSPLTPERPTSGRLS
jgi:hypothetical protein